MQSDLHAHLFEKNFLMASAALKVPLASKFGFGVGDLAFNLIWQGTALFLMYFYTDVLGISAGVAGLIYLVSMIWDAVTDPVMATLADRTETRIGKFRPYILFGALPLALSYPLAFSSSPITTIPVEAWALLTHLILRTAYTVVGVPFSSLQARLTDDAQERTVLAGFRMVGAASGGLTVVFLTPVLLGVFGPEQESLAFISAASIAGGIVLIALLYCGLVMREPERPRQVQTGSFMDDLKSVIPMFIANPPLIRVFAIIVTSSVCLAMFGKNTIYFFKYELERPDLTLWALVTPAAMLLLCVPFWVWLAGRRSKRDALLLGGSIGLIGYLVFFCFAHISVAFAFAAIVLIGIGGSALPVMFWSMLPDTVEYGELKSGRRSEAKIFGFATFAQKAAIGLNALILGLLLDGVGFKPNVDQTEFALLGIRFVMALVPAAGACLILVLALGYRLDRLEHARLVEELRRS